MSNLTQWNATAANNNSVSPDGWPESMAPDGVNDSARENMAAIARFYAGIKGALNTTGSSNAYVLSTGSSHAALGDIGIIVFKANHSNTGASTLAVDGLTATSIKIRGVAVKAGHIIDNETYIAVYNSDSSAFELFGAADVKKTVPNTFTRSQHITPSAVTSSSNAVAIDMQINQLCTHTLTENTTISNPSNLAAGMQFAITVTQHASSSKTLAWGSVFKGSIPSVSSIASRRQTYSFYSPDGTNLDFIGTTGAIA